MNDTLSLYEYRFSGRNTIPRGGGDTQTLPYAKEFFEGGGAQKL